MTKKEIVVMHNRFSAVFNDELKAHGIGAKEFMVSCRIKHDNFYGIKRVAI